MEQRKLRKRIPLKKVTEKILLHDPLSFMANKASIQARKAAEHQELVLIEIWFDKHYYNRYQHGDESGKRNGIDPDLVKEIIIQSISWLISCSGRYKFFRFLNTDKENDPYHRIVLQKNTKEGLLNIVTEFHWITLRRYEVTVKTAMVTDEFRLSDGQFALRLDDTGCVVLKMENNKPREMVQL